MKIYINERYEIKAINECKDENLTEVEVNREQVFGNMSDFMILNYCYKRTEYGHSIYPAFDYSTIKMLDDSLVSKISGLEKENQTLKEELSLTQDAVNEVLFMMMNLK